VAEKELREDIASIEAVLLNCVTDSDVSKHASDIEKHLHKIKGLAPMMGQDEIGNIAALLDKIFKSLLTGVIIAGMYDAMKVSCQFMHDKLDKKNPDYDVIRTLLEKIDGQFTQ
jgi:chemotaxis protein histidine kinase CheA